MTDTQLTAKMLHDKLVEAHRAFYTDDPQAQLNPSLVGYTADREMIMVAIEMSGSGAEKDAIAEKLKALIKAHNIVVYGFFSEAWAASYEKNKVNKMPSEREDKREIVVTVVVHKDGDRICSAMEINRDWETGGAVLGDPECSDGSFGGRFAELFDE